MAPFCAIETGERLMLIGEEVHLVEKWERTVQGTMKPMGDFVGVISVEEDEYIKQNGGEHERGAFF